MRIWSKTIEVFLRNVRQYTKEILQNEFLVRVERTRFHLSTGWNWPITIVAMEHPTHLGMFDHEFNTICINKRLMYQAKPSVIKDILRHELCHYFTKIEFEDRIISRPHGPEFKEICRKYGFGEKIMSPNCNVSEENWQYEGDTKNEKIISRIKKLLSLAESSNKHEAELATIKANQLLIQHNLDMIQMGDGQEDDTEYVVKCVIEGKRITPRIAAISRILRMFLVHPVRSKGSLEVTGTRANVENADYIANYLNRELEKIWKNAKKQNPGLHQKSFMGALAISYCDKIGKARESLSSQEQRSLVIIKEEISNAIDGLYGRLSSTSSGTTRYCQESASLGNLAGKELNINRGISTDGSATFLLN